MKKSKAITLYRFYFGSTNWLDTVKYSLWLSIALVVISPSILNYSIQTAMGQETETSSVSLNKNIIYVHPKSGDDSQTGEKTAPLKTITQALKTATAGATIQLAAGTYDESTGEVFPLLIDRQIVLQGNINNQGHNVIIKGSGDFVSPTAAGQNVAIAALKDAGGIAGVTVTNEHSRGHGLWIESSNPEIVSNTFTRNGNTGVSINGKSSPPIENNYFYNNSGNGLLVYGTSQPQIIENTFEQTGFGVSLVQNAVSTLEDNYFDSNRIGIILEGNSQAILRDNEIINSLESGLTAIAKSRVNLGTSDKPGNNVFRSNKKFDIQNATSNQIVAVGTKTNGNTRGNIDFSSGEFIAAANTKDNLPPLPTALGSNDSSWDEPSSLPSPPPVVEPKTSSSEKPYNNAPKPNNYKEFIFTPSSPTVSETPDPEPVPFLPQIGNSALGSNSSQVSSLSDVLGSRGSASVKYRVLVEAVDEFAQKKVRSFYPEAFSTMYQGKSVLQIGAFKNWDKAKEAQRSLDNMGFDTHILE